MNLFTIAGIVIVAVILVALLLMLAMVRFSTVVTDNVAEIEAQRVSKQAINPALTRGFSIDSRTETKEQLVQAREIAAKRAAATPRGGNMRIGRLDTTDARADVKASTQGIEEDPVTAVKIAEHHTWNGLEIVKQVGAPAAVAAAGTGQMVKRKLVPGKDFEWLALEGLAGADKRRAVIANGKAKSAAYKALKASGADMMEAAAPVAAAPAAAAPAAAVMPANMPEPPTLIEIPEGMDPAEKRKAMIANSKAKSAYNKALKAAGIDPKAAKAAANAPAAASAPEPAAAAAPAAVAAAVPTAANLPPKPDMVAITDDMDDSAKRQAKISNAKAKSAYKKALKAAGIDPKTVEI